MIKLLISQLILQTDLQKQNSKSGYINNSEKEN